MVKPKKWLGQHFLKDSNIAKKTADALDNNKNVLEIGPGTGMLTHILLEKNINLKVIEVDKESVAFLSKKYAMQEQIIEADFLKYDVHHIFEGEKFSVIGNFPYNISSQILFKVLTVKDLVSCVVGMFQKEVAERICAAKGNKSYGILSVLIQAYYEANYLFTVEPHVFKPPPKVKSAVIKLERKSAAPLPCDETLFFSIVKTAFNQRRKTLRNALKKYTFDNRIDSDMMQKRAEQLSVSDFVLLTQACVS